MDKVIVTINDDFVETKVEFKGDELTSPVQQAILYLKSYEGDPFDG